MPDFDWNLARAFRAAAETGSFSAGARKMGLSQPTLSRQVAGLETALGVTLFERGGRRLALTEAGMALLEHVRVMGRAAESMELVASGRAQDIEGVVSISASDGYSILVLPPVLKAIRQAAPQVTLELVVSNALSDLRRREADIAIRHVRPEDPELISQRLYDSTAHLYASKKWVAKHGMPKHPRDLANAEFLGLGQNGRFIPYLRDMGLPVSKANFHVTSENSVAIWELLKLGMGVSVMLREIADRTPGVVQLLPSLPPVPVPVWLVSHRELHTSRRIRLVFDLLAQELTTLRPASSAPPSKRPGRKRP